MRNQLAHGEAVRGKLTVEYKCWITIRNRCNNNKNKDYLKYGGRGVKVCDRWNLFENFLLDMGRRPENCVSLDRVNNDGHYEPGNCRWSTSKEQANNRSNNVTLTLNGETLSIAQWSRKLQIPISTIKNRKVKGLADEFCLSINKEKPGRRINTLKVKI